MRTVEKLPRKGQQMADHRESVDDVLKSVDRQLLAFGLEVVMEEPGSDTAVWVILPRKPKREKKRGAGV